MRTIVLLTISNIFMTFAWYGHLKYRNEALWKMILASWGIAFFEYCFQVPANRIGSTITPHQFEDDSRDHPLSIFPVFSVFYLGEKLKWKPRVGFAFIVAAAFFIFHKCLKKLAAADSGHAHGRPRRARLASARNARAAAAPTQFRSARPWCCAQLRSSLLQRPGAMMNFASNEPVTAVVARDSSAPSGNVRVCPLRKEHGGNRTISPLQCGGSSIGVVSLVAYSIHHCVPTQHPRTEVRQVEPSARDRNGK